MASKDYYQILGVDRNADADTIKKAHRKLVMQHHPDKASGDKAAAVEKFKEIQEAYDVLSDDSKKRNYDQCGSGQPDAFGIPSWSGGNIPTAGNDLQTTVKITLEEAYAGGKKTLHYSREVNCEACHHSGLKPGAQSDPCASCKGTGFVIVAGFGGRFQAKHLCNECRGKGRAIKPENQCTTCAGTGRSKRAEQLEVKIPRGINTREYSVYESYGEAGTNKGPFGNLVVIFVVEDHPTLKCVNGCDLLCDLKLSFVDMCLGAVREVDTPKGSVKLTIPPETPNGRILRVQDYGMFSERMGRQGHLLVKLNADTPVNLTDKQKKLLISFQKEEEGKEKHK